MSQRDSFNVGPLGPPNVDRWTARDVPANWFLVLMAVPDGGGWDDQPEVVLFARELDEEDRIPVPGRIPGPYWKWWSL